MQLSNYKSDNKIENLTQFFDDNTTWQANYIDECPDFLDMYAEHLYDNEIYLGELESEDLVLVQYLMDNGHEQLIFETSEVEHTKGYHRVSNEIASIGLGEIEIQLTGLSDGNCNCVYSELVKNMTKEDIKQAESNAEHYVSNEYIYMDYTYDRVSLVLNINLLIEELK